MGSLTDLFLRTFPAESKLSEMLQAVPGLRSPDETAEKSSVKLKGEEAVVCLQLCLVQVLASGEHLRAFVFCTQVVCAHI